MIEYKTLRMLAKILVLCLACVGSSPAMQAAQTKAPKLVTPSREYNLGVVYSGEVRSLKVRISNTGTDTLHILAVQPSCGCTTAKMPRQTLAPGDSDLLELEFRSTGFQGDVTKHVNIQSDDPTSRSTVVTFHANVKAEFAFFRHKVQSNQIVLGNYPVGVWSKDTVFVLNISSRVVSARSVVPNSNNIAAAFDRKKIAPGDTARLIVSVLPRQQGYGRDIITVHTGNKTRPEIPIPVVYMASPSR